MNLTTDEAERAALMLRVELPNLSHSRSLEIVAHQLGHLDWHTASATFARGLGTAVPVLRVPDMASALEFYRGYLGCTVLQELRFGPGMPTCTRIRRDRLVVDLSERTGDGTPGSVVWVPVTDIHALHRELSAKNHPSQPPDVDEDTPGGPTLTVTDPFANVLRFCQAVRP
jgi:catechol 2,3-dioxygenase-like lactoylglutathione lyase family enzyme